MSKYEMALPPEQQFDFAVELLQDEFYAGLESNIEKYKDIIDPNVEFDYDTARIWGLCGHFTSLFCDPEHDPYLVRETFYRSMCFGLEVSGGLSPKDSAGVLPIGELLQEFEDPAEAINQEVSTYLSQRPHIYQLIGYFMSEIDDSGRRNHYAEIGAGIIFMLSERRDGAYYVQKMADNLSPDDFSN